MRFPSPKLLNVVIPRTDVAAPYYPSAAVTCETLQLHEGPLVWVGWSPDNRWLATVGLDGKLMLMQAHSLQVVDQVEGLRQVGFAGAWHPTGTWLALTGHPNKGVVLWDAHNQVERLLECRRVCCLAWAGAAQLLLATGTEDGEVVVWEAEWGRGRHCWKLPQSPVTALAFDPAGGVRLAACTAEGKVFVFEHEAAVDEMKQLPSDPAWGDALVLSWRPQGTVLAAGFREGQVGLWDSTTGERLHVLQGTSSVCQMTWEPGGGRLAVSHSDGWMALWQRPATMEVVASPQQALFALAREASSQAGTRKPSHTLRSTTLEKWVNGEQRVIWDARDGSGRTLLHHAAEAGDATLLRRLLGAATECSQLFGSGLLSLTRDVSGRTPLDVALQRSWLEGAMLLLDAATEQGPCGPFAHSVALQEAVWQALPWLLRLSPSYLGRLLQATEGAFGVRTVAERLFVLDPSALLLGPRLSSSQLFAPSDSGHMQCSPAGMKVLWRHAATAPAWHSWGLRWLWPLRNRWPLPWQYPLKWQWMLSWQLPSTWQLWQWHWQWPFTLEWPPRLRWQLQRTPSTSQQQQPLTQQPSSTDPKMPLVWNPPLDPAGNEVAVRCSLVTMHNACAPAPSPSSLLFAMEAAGCTAQLYSQPAARHIIAYKWKAVARAYMMRELGLHCITLTLMSVYVYLLPGYLGTVEETGTKRTVGKPRGGFVAALEVFLVLLLSREVLVEVAAAYAYAVHRIGSSLRRACWDVFHSCFTLGMFLSASLARLLATGEVGGSGTVVAVTAALAALLLWSRLLRHASRIRPSGAFVLLVARVVWDLRGLLLVLLAGIIAFSQAFYVLFLTAVPASLPQEFADGDTALLTVFRYLFLDFNVALLGFTASKPLSLFLFCCFMLLACMMMVAVAVAVASDTVVRVRAWERDESWRDLALTVNRVELVLLRWGVPRSRLQFPSYLYVFERADELRGSGPGGSGVVMGPGGRTRSSVHTLTSWPGLVNELDDRVVSHVTALGNTAAARGKEVNELLVALLRGQERLAEAVAAVQEAVATSEKRVEVLEKRLTEAPDGIPRTSQYNPFTSSLQM